jgi:beta-catenin-like protein 1
VQNSVFELLVDNLSRLNEQEDADRQGVFHVLGRLHQLLEFINMLTTHSVPGIFENMIGFSPSLASDLLSKTKILPWLLNRIQSKIHDENRGYSAELLSILLQNSQSNKLLLGQNDGVEIILKVLAVSFFLFSPYQVTIMNLFKPAISPKRSC